MRHHGDSPDLALEGSEEDLRQRILEEPDILEEGFQPMMTERETPAGPVDLWKGRRRNADYR